MNKTIVMGLFLIATMLGAALPAIMMLSTVVPYVSAIQDSENSASNFAPGNEKRSAPLEPEDNSARDFAPGREAIGNPDVQPSDLAPGHGKRIIR
ncbi:MAG: hypothetical protein ACRD47_06160 [Nitrososphaeraceae archaeon]